MKRFQKLKTVLFLITLLSMISCKDSKSAEVYNIKGTVRIENLEPSDRTEIQPNTTIIAEKGSSADIKFPDGSLARIEDGELTVETFKDRVKLNLKYGKVYSSVTSGSKYEIESATAAAGVRGTEFFFEEKEDSKSYICVCHGSVWVHKVGETDEKIVKQGEDLWVKPDSPLKDPVLNPDMSQMTVDVITDLKASAK